MALILGLSGCATSSETPGNEELKKSLRRPYAQLSESEQQKLKASYDPMPPGDEPPYPLGGLAAWSDPIGQLLNARIRKIVQSGKKLPDPYKIRLASILTISAEGRVVKIDFPQLPAEFAKADFLPILGSIAFKPAYCSGRPCVMDYLVDITVEATRI